MKTKTQYSCPLCSSTLVSQPGSSLNETNGVTIWCEDIKCPAQEVFGHGNNEKAAFEIITAKYKKPLDFNKIKVKL